MAEGHTPARLRVPCLQCGRPFLVYASARKRRLGAFCSRACCSADRKAWIAERYAKQAAQVVSTAFPKYSDGGARSPESADRLAA